jgi:hypothetical protein
MVFEHEHEHLSQWAAILSIAEKIVCPNCGYKRDCTDP